MRYSKLHEQGTKPPVNTLDSEAWHNLPPASKQGAVFTVRNKNEKPFSITVKGHAEQVARALMERPMKSASRCRISQYVAALRSMGLEIDTEGFRTGSRESYGVYMMRSQLSEVQP
ncbi:MAG: hypothetical protein ABJ251_12360 [Paracoccaceae bacterium]